MSQAELTRYYAQRAREYERIYERPERQVDLEWLRKTLPPMFSGRRVLEIACGTGYWTQFLARETRAIVGLDVNDETLEIARSKRLPEERVAYRVADAYAPPEDLGEFDGAFAGFWWSHILIRDRRRFFEGLDRRLAPGARVALLDNLYVEGSSTPISRRDDEGNTYQARRLEDGSQHEVLKNFPSEAQLAADIAGFGVNTRFTALQYYWLFTYDKPAAPHPGPLP
jgi:demethylmenaquinone methyltransferase/2-methoxy-6-polyprenyl-1,4-benzoquinol methylase